MSRALKVIGAMLGGVALLAGWLTLVDPTYRGDISPTDAPLIIAHRGFGYDAPDNSGAAIKLAMDAGLDGVDVDGRLTADGEIILFHHPTVDEVSDGTGAVAEMTLEQLRALDIGPSFHPDHPTERIITLGEAIALVDGAGILMIELKTTATEDTGIERRAIALIEAAQAWDWVYLSSFNPVSLYRIESLDSRVRTVFIFQDHDVDPEEVARVHGGAGGVPFFLRSEPLRRLIRRLVRPDLLSVHREVDPATISRLQASGNPLFLWPPDAPADLDAAAALSPYGIITNVPLDARSRLR